MRDSKNMAEKTEKQFPLAPATYGQELIMGACNELFKDAYAGLLNDRPKTQLSFENIFGPSRELAPEELFKENASARLFS